MQGDGLGNWRRTGYAERVFQIERLESDYFDEGEYDRECRPCIGGGPPRVPIPCTHFTVSS
jgi:hypothetical protein